MPTKANGKGSHRPAGTILEPVVFVVMVMVACCDAPAVSMTAGGFIEHFGGVAPEPVTAQVRLTDPAKLLMDVTVTVPVPLLPRSIALGVMVKSEMVKPAGEAVGTIFVRKASTAPPDAG